MLEEVVDIIYLQFSPFQRLYSFLDTADSEFAVDTIKAEHETTHHILSMR